MSAFPYMPFFCADYMADTRHLSTEEHGAYLLLIIAYWQTGRPLPADDARLARLAGLSNERWTDVQRTLNPFFTVVDGEWRHGRIDAELEKARSKSEKAKIAGQASGRRRNSGNQQNQHTDPTDVERTFNVRSTGVEPQSNHSDTDINKKESNPLTPLQGADPVELYESIVANSLKASANSLATLANSPTKAECLEAFNAYNATALRCALPQASKFTGDRERKIRARLRDYGRDGWTRALANLEKSTFLTGGTDQGFRADLEFVCQAKSFSKLHDGGYGNGRHAKPAVGNFGHVAKFSVANPVEPNPARVQALIDDALKRSAL